MNASTSSGFLTEANAVAMPGAKPNIDIVWEEVCFNDRSCQQSSGDADVPDEDGLEAFIGGAGI
jgi:hypothetical protein